MDLPIVRRLSPGSAADDPEGQKLMEQVPTEIGNKKPLLRTSRRMKAMVVVQRQKMRCASCRVSEK